MHVLTAIDKFDYDELEARSSIVTYLSGFFLFYNWKEVSLG